MLWHWCWHSQPTGLSALGTITITIITITITTIARITIRTGPNAYAGTQNRWETGCWLHWDYWVGDWLSPWSNCLPSLQNVRMQLSTPWLRGIMRFYHGGLTNDMIHTTMFANIMISANICCLPPTIQHTPPTACILPDTARHPPPASCLPLSGVCNSASLWIEHAGASMGAYSQVSLGVSCHLRVYLRV